MRTRELAGRSVSTVGLGDVSLARASKRGRDPREVFQRVGDALERGITVIDVAPEDEAERMVGESIRALRMRDRAVMVTHVPSVGRDLPVRYLVERIDMSLRATKLDALPLVMLPLRAAWRAASAWPELVGWCARLVREGKVEHWGVHVTETSRDEVPNIPRVKRAVAPAPEPMAPRPAGSLILLPDEAVMADPALAIAVEVARGATPAPVETDGIAHPAVGFLDEPWLAALAVEFAMCARDALPLIAQAKVPVFARHPLAGGALAGTIGPGIAFAPKDDRRELTPAQLERIAVGVAKLASRVKQMPIAAQSCEAAKQIVETTPRPPNVLVNTIAELALRYAIDRGTIPLPRIHTREAFAELRGCASAEPLPPALIEMIDELMPQELDD